ncbi:hypothetical protein [Marinospirillum insulare]|nr:hypothetical protein [Marinospirillum insulare]
MQLLIAIALAFYKSVTQLASRLAVWQNTTHQLKVSAPTKATWQYTTAW